MNFEQAAVPAAVNSVFKRKAIRTRIYACGGFASKALNRFLDAIDNEGLNHLSVCVVDTSASDLEDSKLNLDQVMLIPDMDGGAKDRRVTYPLIVPHVPTIIQKFQPADFNIVLMSCGGGSGSSIGPALTRQLLKSGEQVVVVAVGSIGSKTEVSNTVGTLTSLANFTELTQRPLAVYYRENNEETSRASVDKDVQSALFLLSLLFSAENKGLDTADLRAILEYHTRTSFEPELSSIDFHCNSINLATGHIAQSGAVLYAHASDDESADGYEKPDHGLEFLSDGFLSKARTEKIGGRCPIYAVVYSGELATRIDNLRARLSGYEAQEKARVNTLKKVATSIADDDGMVY